MNYSEDTKRAMLENKFLVDVKVTKELKKYLNKQADQMQIESSVVICLIVHDCFIGYKTSIDCYINNQNDSLNEIRERLLTESISEKAIMSELAIRKLLSEYVSEYNHRDCFLKYKKQYETIIYLILEFYLINTKN